MFPGYLGLTQRQQCQISPGRPSLPVVARAWTFRNGWTAPQCVGVIHTDFERGFIKAEVYAIPDLLEHGSETALRGVGKLRIEGKAYEVKAGDGMHFRFNV